jgi:hypothetical protein|uniref:Uncharacterized protein n=1 Tax=Myoviridae sp. ctcPl3 TaxID=2826669 RepID=A0A8S5QXD1_9CAUD|nr:MAG TPA: hypothetical protein [Myoviridae sp. ctcPl3]
MEDKEYIEMNLADTIMERPYGFHVSDRQFYVYPVTLGKTYLLSRLMKELDVNGRLIELNPYMEALRLCETKRDMVCRLLSYHTFNKREELFDNSLVAERADFFVKELNNEDMAKLLIMVLSNGDVSTFIKHLAIDEEKEWLRKVSKAKKNNGSFVFGGKSVYGTLIDAACERYGWTMEYVVWGISYANLQMLLADAVTSIYLSDEERKKLHIPMDRNVIKADDPENIEKIMSMNWD